MQEEYDSIDWKIKSFWVLLAVGAGTVGQWIFVAAVAGSLSFFFSLGPLVNLSPSGWLWTIIFALFLTTLLARDECNWIVEHISPGGISIIFSISKYTLYTIPVPLLGNPIFADWNLPPLPVSRPALYSSNHYRSSSIGWAFLLPSLWKRPSTSYPESVGNGWNRHSR
mgnify:CR=1 FL=1